MKPADPATAGPLVFVVRFTSTGAYGYPLAEAAPGAFKTVADYLKNHPEIELKRFVLFDQNTLKAYKEALKGLPGT